jgi:myosin heavy subunit
MIRTRRNLARRANSGMPGTDNLGGQYFGHPAYYTPKDVQGYGIDSDFGEGIHKGPYLSGPPPASVSWIPDHPAVDEELVEDYETGNELRELNLKQAMERKASKCIRLAQKKLGRRASSSAIENLALSYMDLPNRVINTKLGSSFMAGDELQEATGFYGDDLGVGNVNADDMDIMSGMSVMADHDVQDATGYHLTQKGIGNKNASRFSRYAEQTEAEELAEEAIETAEELAEEVETLSETVETMAEEIKALKKANSRLKRVSSDDSSAEEIAEEALDVAETLAEEVDNLKKANARLRRAGKEPVSFVNADGDEVNFLADKKAGINRLASVLSDFLAEDGVEADENELTSLGELMSEIEAEESLDAQATKYAYNRHSSQNDPSSYMYSQQGGIEQDMPEESKTASWMADDMMSEGVESEDIFGLDVDGDVPADPHLASLFMTAEDQNMADEMQAEQETKGSKTASFMPRPKTITRQASVKTLGNISRTASSKNETSELSKLWESAPDVSKFFK